MKILAIDTSTMLGGVALLNGETLLAESRLNVKVTHSERLLGEIDHILKQAALKIEDVDIFGVATGPGSFTGLRVGLSVIKGLAFATGKKIVAVPTLEAFAWNIPYSRYQVCPLLDARKKEVYAAIFRWAEDNFIKELEEQPLKIEKLLDKIQEPTIFLGDGAIIYKVNIQDRLQKRAIFPPLQFMVPSPSNVAYLAMKRAQKGYFEDIIKITPLYLRKSEAEIKSESVSTPLLY
ncbi:MAG: tRNA (adenosine(37)-N6)-threonylcarbamoyltransferase complex dimerization subunit type 1 TsaB [Thermodesulfovibrionales bacterium]|nr:tRNA (adenosine(37)-N6)-threonylcarbamoyltransferase complex dimerization subunit type 1 TsaB [Thermodesulfovibrionales bacterium]